MTNAELAEIEQHAEHAEDFPWSGILIAEIRRLRAENAKVHAIFAAVLLEEGRHPDCRLTDDELAEMYTIVKAYRERHPENGAP